MEFVWAAPASEPGAPPPLPPAAAGLPAPPGAVDVAPNAAAPSSSPTSSPHPEAAQQPAVSASDGAAESVASSGLEAAAAPILEAPRQVHTSMWVTVIPPSMLEAGTAKPNAATKEEVEVPSRALGHIIGANQKGLKEIEAHSGTKVSVRNRGDEESHAHMVFEGSKIQIAAAKAVLEQKLVMAIGADKMERLQKHQNSAFLAKLNSETGVDAATGGVNGLKEFAEKWKLKAVLVRKLKKLDVMMQRYLIRHFKPWKAKPANALRSYVTTLLMQPQRWRLHALFEEGELDGEICETIVVGDAGAVVGRPLAKKMIMKPIWQNSSARLVSPASAERILAEPTLMNLTLVSSPLSSSLI